MLIRSFLHTFLITFVVFFLMMNSSLSAEFIAVNAKKSILYEGPSTSTSKEFIVTESYPLRVLVKLKDWIKVKDHKDKISWIKYEDTSRERKVLTLKKNVILFYERSYSSVKLADIDENVALKLLSPLNTDGWIQVKTLSQNIEGYIRAEDVWGI